MSKLKAGYEAYNCDYADALERCAGDEELLRSLLDMFTADDNYMRLMAALDASNAENGFRAAHSLKGSSGMLGFTGLFNAMKRITEPLRRGDAAQAVQYRAEVEREYAAVSAMIKSL